MTTTERRIFDPRFELAGRDEIEAYQLGRISALIERTWKRNAFYRDLWKSRGGRPVPIDSFERFRAEIPITRKADLVADQAAHPPYGKRLAAVDRRRQPYLLFTTSGTSGQGVELHAITHAERRRAYAVSGYGYRWAGLERGHSVFLCYGITMLGGGRIELYGLEEYGLSVYPVGSYDVERKLDILARHRPDAVMCTTSYIGHLSAVGLKRGPLHRPKVLFGGGEGASFAWFEHQQELWGAPIFNHYGATQTRVDLMYPCERGLGTRDHPGMLHNVEPGFYVEVIDPETGRHVGEGERGELVITSLIHTDFPLIRHGMGDAAIWRPAHYCSCGRPFSGVEVGSVARMDDMKKIKGINVWPQAVEEALFVHGGVDEYRVVLSRDAAEADVATVQVMAKPGVSADQRGDLCRRIRDELRRRIGIGFEVVEVPSGQIAQSEYKARRWIDRRQDPAPS
ncbi:MAG: AMP-binding protein [Dongiaceae bacterium]